MTSLNRDSSEGPIVAPTEALELGAVEEAIHGADEAATSLSSESSSRRLLGYDLARFLAFVGMIAVNYRVVMDTSFSAPGPEWLGTAFGAVPGRAAALFVLLAGVGVTLLSRAAATQRPRARRPIMTALRHVAFLLFLGSCGFIVGFHVFGSLSIGQAVEAQGIEARLDAYAEHLEGGGMRRYFLVLGGVLAFLTLAFAVLGKNLSHPRAVLAKRALFLFAIGYSWMPMWTGDILHFYGIFLLVGALVVSWRTWILGVMLVATIGMGFWWQLNHEFLADWSLLVLEYKNPWTLEGALRSLFFNGWHGIFPWLSFFLVGLLVGRVGRGSWKSRLSLLLIGLGLMGAARFASPWVEEKLADKDQAAVLEIVSIEEVAIASGTTLLGPVLNEEGRPRLARARIPLLIDGELDRDAHDKKLVDARRLRRSLRGSRDAGPYAEMRMSLAPLDKGQVVLRLDFAHDTEKSLPEDRDATYEEAVYRMASWMSGRRRGLWQAADAGILGLSGRWPRSLESVEIRRLVPIRTESNEIEMVVDRKTQLSQSSAKDVDLVYLNAKRQMGLGCWPNPGVFFVLDAIGLALVIIATMLTLVSREWRWLKKLLYPFTTAGRMALTLYLAHILIGLMLLDWMEILTGASLQVIAVSVLSCAFIGTAGAVAWRAFFRMGPLESVMRWLTR